MSFSDKVYFKITSENSRLQINFGYNDLDSIGTMFIRFIYHKKKVNTFQLYDK